MVLFPFLVEYFTILADLWLTYSYHTESLTLLTQMIFDVLIECIWHTGS